MENGDEKKQLDDDKGKGGDLLRRRVERQNIFESNDTITNSMTVKEKDHCTGFVKRWVFSPQSKVFVVNRLLKKLLHKMLEERMFFFFFFKESRNVIEF